MKLVQYSQFPCYLVPPRSLCPQHPILKHPQPMFLLQSVTPIKTTGKSYSSLYFNPCVYGWHTGRHKIMDRTVVGNPPIQPSPNFFLNAVLNVGVIPIYLNSSVLWKDVLPVFLL
jgi:hypothetical protein